MLARCKAPLGGRGENTDKLLIPAQREMPLP